MNYKLEKVILMRIYALSPFQDRTLKVWRAEDGVLCRTLTGHAHWINTLTLNVDYILRVGFFSAEEQYKGEAIAKPQTEPEKVWFRFELSLLFFFFCINFIYFFN